MVSGQQDECNNIYKVVSQIGMCIYGNPIKSLKWYMHVIYLWWFRLYSSVIIHKKNFMEIFASDQYLFKNIDMKITV